ncbi:MAG: ArnT family glycosyltransferase, partial [Ktedonobacterales bacterium]
MTASEQREEVASTSPAPETPVDKTTVRWDWACQWEFWLAVGLGAVLRLWQLGSTQFLVDQATLMTLARDAVLRHALPVASLPSSIHSLNPPLSVYLLVPFTIFGKDPFPAVVALALWNVAGVALCYIFALRYFGRRVAAVGALFFAACSASVLYSRFLWPPNYLPPLLTLAAMAIFAGCVRGKRGMLAPAVTLLALGALLHPSVLLLAPALLAGVLLAPHAPRWRDYALSLIIVAVLLVPTVLWEAASGWSDVRVLTAYTSGHASVDPEVFFRLYEALGAPSLPQAGSGPHAPPHSLAEVAQLLAAPVTSPSLGASSPYAALAPLYVALGLAAILLFAVGWLVLTARVLAPAWALWRGQPEEQRSLLVRIVWWTSAIWHG